MNVSLPLAMQDQVRAKVSSGEYASASEVVREALSMFLARDASRDERLQALRDDISIGIKQLESGSASPFDDASVARMKARGRAALAATRG